MLITTTLPDTQTSTAPPAPPTLANPHRDKDPHRDRLRRMLRTLVIERGYPKNLIEEGEQGYDWVQLDRHLQEAIALVEVLLKQ